MNRILVAEDDPVVRKLIGLQLAQNKFHVTEVENGEAAFEKLKSEAFDLLVTDRNMEPGMNGIELARIASKIQPRILIILFTSDFKGLENNRPACIHRTVIKPEGLSRLPDVIRELLSAKV